MKEDIFNNYQIIVENIEKINDNVAKIITSSANYYYYQTRLSETVIKEAYEVYGVLKNHNILTNEIIKTIYNTYSTKDNYVLVKINKDLINNLDLEDILLFSDNQYMKNNRSSNLSNEWALEVDQINKLIVENKINDIDILTIHHYYVGLAENAIYYYNMYVNKETHLVVPSHRIITLYANDLYNPLNLYWDSRVKDLSDYFKLKMINKSFDIQELEYVLITKKWDKNDILELIARLMYCNNYFDSMKRYLSDKKEDIKKYLLIANTYQNDLKIVMMMLNQYYQIPIVYWLIAEH